MSKIFYRGREYAGYDDNTNPKINLASYGTSPTSGSTTTKVVTTNGGNYKRVSGAYVAVTFDNANTGNVSLNVDSTGSKYAYYNGSRLNANNGNFSSGETVTFMYDGTYYQRLDTDTDDTSILKSLARLGWTDVLSSGVLVVKKLIAKALGRIGKFSTTSTVNLNSDWTAPSDGIINAVVGWTQQSYGYMYIKDVTVNEIVCGISNANSLGGFIESTSFPVIKGHVYKVEMSAQVGSLNTKFYSL